ncbi:unnamed protein product [Protopolystoma xenopodis]|uniref:Uncharacterized protein n=1 Tax=Protopolystoma xenopodis TaxID=117903 RepID=A0A3S5AEW0_9PLAT|nr:unnamed protein product [Protopolystoma xenopodis]
MITVPSSAEPGDVIRRLRFGLDWTSIATGTSMTDSWQTWQQQHIGTCKYGLLELPDEFNSIHLASTGSSSLSMDELGKEFLDYFGTL